MHRMRWTLVAGGRVRARRFARSGRAGCTDLGTGLARFGGGQRAARGDPGASKRSARAKRKWYAVHGPINAGEAMTPEQRQLLQNSWATVERRGDELAAMFYDRLFELDPRARALFAATDMAQQRAKFILMLGSIVRVMDDIDQLVPEATALGRRHAGYDVHAADYDTVGQSLLWMFEQALGDEFDDAVRMAWGDGYRLLAALMQRASVSRDGSATGAD